MTEAKKTRKRNERTLKPYSSFTDTATALDLTKMELCQMMGYSHNTYCSWAKSGQIPEVVDLACRGLMAQNGHVEKQQKTLLIRLAKDKETAVIAVLDAMDVDFTII